MVKGIPRPEYDLVTLLISRFPNTKPSSRNYLFGPSAWQVEKKKVFVVSIPDYRYTPYGERIDRANISEEIDRYHQFARETARASGVQFMDITAITRQGLVHPELVAGDGLHPSGEAYSLFVARLLTLVTAQLTP